MKALFLDRDGVINKDYGYVYKIEKFEFNEGIFELLKLFIDKGYTLFVVTNQSGIARGYYKEEDFAKLTDYMLQELKKEGITIQKVVHCPNHPDTNPKCRKPNTGMIDNILKNYPINLKESWMIGDKQSDIDLAINANIAKSIAIGKQDIKKACYNFKNIKECSNFFKTNNILI